MIEQNIKIYEGINFTVPVNNIIYLPVLKAGTITRLDIIIGALNAAGDTVFNLKLNGADQFAGAGRPKVVASATLGSLTGLSIAVVVGDILQVDLESVPTGGVTAPVTLNVEIDDGVSSGGAADLDDLTDVVITSPTTGDVLTFDGTNWINDTPTTGGAVDIDDLTDVVITTPATGDILEFDGTNWVNVIPSGGGSLPAWLTEHPDATPTSPNAADDEFSGVSLGGSWTPDNAGSSLATTVANGALKMTVTASDPAEPRSLTKNLASQVGTFTAKITLLGNDIGSYKGGLAIRQAANSNSRFIGLRFTSGTYYVGTWRAASNAAGTTAVQTAVISSRTLYVQAENDGTNLYLRFSNDGRHYFLFETLLLSSYFTGNADDIGFFVEANGNSAGVGITAEWFRVS